MLKGSWVMGMVSIIIINNNKEILDMDLLLERVLNQL